MYWKIEVVQPIYQSILTKCHGIEPPVRVLSLLLLFLLPLALALAFSLAVILFNYTIINGFMMYNVHVLLLIYNGTVSEWGRWRKSLKLSKIRQQEWTCVYFLLSFILSLSLSVWRIKSDNKREKDNDQTQNVRVTKNRKFKLFRCWLVMWIKTQ